MTRSTLLGHDYRTILLKEFIMKTIRNMAAYNSMLAEIKKVVATETITNYLIIEDRNCSLYGGKACYDHYASGAYTDSNGTSYSTEYANTVGTISSDGNCFEEEIKNISVDIALRAIKNALKEAFSAPAFIGNDECCPEDDDGMWWNNHRLVPSSVQVEINNHRWVVNFQD